MNRVRTYEGIRRGARLQYKESGIGPEMKEVKRSSLLYKRLSILSDR